MRDIISSPIPSNRNGLQTAEEVTTPTPETEAQVSGQIGAWGRGLSTG